MRRTCKSAEPRLEELDADTRQLQESAREEGDRPGALDVLKVRTAIAREHRGYLELLGRATGELSDSAGATTINLVCVLSVPKLPGVPVAIGAVKADVTEPSGD